MTRYEQGFLTKCAERGLDANTSLALMSKVARETRDHGEGALLGAKIGLGVGGGAGAAITAPSAAEGLVKNFRKMKLKNKITGILSALGLTAAGAAYFGAPAAVSGAVLGGLIGRKNKD